MKKGMLGGITKDKKRYSTEQPFPLTTWIYHWRRGASFYQSVIKSQLCPETDIFREKPPARLLLHPLFTAHFKSSGSSILVSEQNVTGGIVMISTAVIITKIAKIY